MPRLSLRTSLLFQTIPSSREEHISHFYPLGQKNSWCVVLHGPSPDVSSFKPSQPIQRSTVLLLRLFWTFRCWIAVCDLFYELLALPSFCIIFKGVTSGISNHMIAAKAVVCFF